MDVFKIGNKINPEWRINIPERKIYSGCRSWSYATLEELLEAIEVLVQEINETGGEQ